MRSPLQAEECLQSVAVESARAGKALSLDASWVVPYATFERATILREQGEDAAAAELFESAK